MRVKTVDVDTFADVFGIERNIAYGFLRFISEAKLVQTGKRPQPKGKKGKPATLFHLDASLGERLVAYIDQNMKGIESVDLVEQAVATPAVEPAPIVEQATNTTSNGQ